MRSKYWYNLKSQGQCFLVLITSIPNANNLQALVDPRGGGARDAPPDPNSLIFQQFSAKVLQNNRTLGVGSPAQRNPGSLTDRYKAARNVFPLYHSILVAYVIPTSTFLYIFQYRLETFNEWRGTGWTTCPYYGGNVDGPGNGRTPSGWDIEMFPTNSSVTTSRRMRCRTQQPYRYVLC